MVSEVENEQNKKPTEFELILLIYKTDAPVRMHQLVAPLRMRQFVEPIQKYLSREQNCSPYSMRPNII
jgi:hypothetical protein